MPEIIDRCIQKVKKTVIPRDPEQTKEDAAWAICTNMYQKSKNKKKKSESENDVIRTAQMMDPSLVNPMSAPADRPPIEGFVRMPEGEVEDNTRTHTCTLTFTADANMSESDIMSLFMSLKEQGIKPTRFQWVESTPTKK